MKSFVYLLIVVAACASLSLARPPSRRKNIESLTPEELLSYRERFQAALDNGFFQKVAGWHGMPLMSQPEATGFCVHGTPAFLLWHRFYLAVMEMIIGCPIPYWDWTSRQIPRAFSDAFYTGRNGSTLVNPLHSAFLPTNVRTVDNPGPIAQRVPESPFPSVDLREKEDFAIYATNDFLSFTAALEDCHNLAHVVLGGALAYIDVAAFDPMFWSLHMNTERLFFEWQLIHDDYVYPKEVSSMPIELNSYQVPAAALLPYFDGWKAGTPSREIQRWKRSLKDALAKRQKASNFTVLEDMSMPMQNPAGDDNIIAPVNLDPTGGAMTLPNQAAVHLVAALSPAEEHPLHRTLIRPDLQQPVASGLATSLAGSTPTFNANSSSIPRALSPLPTDPILTPASVQSDNATAAVVDQHVECPFPVAQIAASRNEDHVMLTLKKVPSTQDPYVLLTILDGRIVAKTGMFGMGPSPMASYVMDRPVDLSRAYEKLGYRLNGTNPSDLSPKLEFRMKHSRTGVETPYNPPATEIVAKCF